MTNRERPLLLSLALCSAATLHYLQGETEIRPSRVDSVASSSGSSLHDLRTSPAAAEPLDEACDEAAPWAEDRVMVAGYTEELQAVAAALGTTLLREPGRSGYGVMATPDGMSVDALIERLKAEPGVLDVSHQGRMQAAATAALPEDLSSLQWHLGAVKAPTSPSSELATVVVAVLDSGVAYEAYTEPTRGGKTYAPAPSLAASTFVAPYDFVNDDAHANDDNQHGTHIASTLAATGRLRGVAPGVSIMPVKVLDHQSQGYESDLVEAVYYAVDHGADVINMSLSFAVGYRPSRALLDALAYAEASGVVMVAAAGNQGLNAISWPAASPRVIAVGASCPTAGGGSRVPAYANRSAEVDLSAPGGCIDQDVDGDGYPDGILAETIDASHPDQMALYLYAGTSQAAAIASGAAAWMIAEGADPFQVDELLRGAGGPGTLRRVMDGRGNGDLDLEEALGSLGSAGARTDRRHLATLMPYSSIATSANVVPTARVSLFDEAGRPVANANLIVRLQGTTQGTLTCRTSSAGSCTVQGPAGSHARSFSGGWLYTIEGAILHDRLHRAEGVIFHSKGLDSAVGAMQQHPRTAAMVLGYYWDMGIDPALGRIMTSVVVNDLAVGNDYRPSAWIYQPSWADVQSWSEPLSLGGSGISTSPFPVRPISLGGSGISTSPFPVIEVLAFKGTGISTSPFPIRGTFSPPEAPALPGNLEGAPVYLSTGMIGSSADTSASSLQGVLDRGGFVTESDQPAASELGATKLERAAVATPGSGSANGVVPL